MTLEDLLYRLVGISNSAAERLATLQTRPEFGEEDTLTQIAGELHELIDELES